MVRVFARHTHSSPSIPLPSRLTTPEGPGSPVRRVRGVMWGEGGRLRVYGEKSGADCVADNIGNGKTISAPLSQGLVLVTFLSHPASWSRFILHLALRAGRKEWRNVTREDPTLCYHRSFVPLHLTHPSSSSTPYGLRGNRGGEVKGNGTGPTMVSEGRRVERRVSRVPLLYLASLRRLPSGSLAPPSLGALRAPSGRYGKSERRERETDRES